MDVITPVPPPSITLQPVAPTAQAADALQQQLQPYQFIPATIVEQEGGRVLLDLGHQKLWAQARSEIPLPLGTPLRLQVLATQPQLQLQVLPQGLDAHLLRLLPLFNRQVPMGEQLAQLLLPTAQPAGNSALPPALQQPLQLFAALLQGRPASVETVTAQAMPGREGGVSPQIPGTQNVASSSPLQPQVAMLLGAEQKVSPVVGQTAPALLRQALAALPPVPVAPGGTLVGLEPAVQVLNTLLQVLEPLASGGASLQGAALAAPKPALLAADEAVARLQQLPETARAELLQLLPQLEAVLPTVLPEHAPGSAELEAARGLLQQLAVLLTGRGASLGPAAAELLPPPAEQLQQLVRMLGLDLEGRLFHGAVEEARASLKGLLLGLQDQLEAGPQKEGVQQLLQQLELLQLCRARLAQDGLIFLPLPFDGLQQGYVLVEEHAADADRPQRRSYSVQLNLRLSQLGDLNVHLLLEGQQLFVRLCCASEDSAAVMRASQAGLERALQPLGLRSLQVALGAQSPEALLVQRLAPQHHSFVDRRV
ncbi:flagellar hook-length control protein FliK [Desulfuromonas thiophila]|uniref:flagellar hook-length control protein FliK n=1 Tax=Desulfuromonas thiophila TaxID=57664 RepID=UPI0029F5C060|nr:flagellar hook-length control protein FliK [Desulfuromonas thiophila]